MRAGDMVTTPTGRTGSFVGYCKTLTCGGRDGPVERARVALPSRAVRGGWLVCRYDPADVRLAEPPPADSPGKDCDEHGPYADDDCPKCDDESEVRYA